MKKIILTLAILFSLSTVTYAEDEVDVPELKISKSIPGGVGIPQPLHLTAPLTFWAGGVEFYAHFNDDTISGKYTGFLNCLNKKNKETQELVMDDNRVFLYCKPVNKEKESK